VEPPNPSPEEARAALAAERATTLRRIGALTAEFDEIVAGSADSNADDEHDPEGSTIAFERAQTAALLAEAHAYLEELDGAMPATTGPVPAAAVLSARHGCWHDRPRGPASPARGHRSRRHSEP
jgi:hypothetical protein